MLPSGRSVFKQWGGEQKSKHGRQLNGRTCDDTCARLAQVTSLLKLALENQAQILSLPPIEDGGDRIHDRQLQPIVAVREWGGPLGARKGSAGAFFLVFSD